MKKTENKSEKKINWIDDQFAISGVKNHSDSCTFFNLYVKSAVGNVAIYGCKVVSVDGHDDFIAWPSRSYEKDGKTAYSNHCSILFDKGMERKIIDEIAKNI